MKSIKIRPNYHVLVVFALTQLRRPHLRRERRAALEDLILDIAEYAEALAKKEDAKTKTRKRRSSR